MKKVLFVLFIWLIIGCESNKEKEWTVCECKEKEIEFNKKSARAKLLKGDDRSKYESEWSGELEEFVIACEYFLEDYNRSDDENERILKEMMDCGD
jgi:hypothetical protein